MTDNEVQTRVEALRVCERMGEEGVRADLDEGGENISPTYRRYVREWLYAKDRKRNERMNRLATASAISAGVAAVAALVTAFITSCHSGHP